MIAPRRWALSVPLEGIPLADQLSLYREAEERGFTDLWSLEVDGVDCFTPLALAAAATQQLRLGTAIANVYTRGPATLAITAAGIEEAAPGRFWLGIGTGSEPIVENWNGGQFQRPAARVRDMVTVLRAAFAGERVSARLSTLSVEGFRLSRPPARPIPIAIAALREHMLRLAGEVADGVILNWLSAADVTRSVAIVHEAARRAGRDPAAIEIVARIFVSVDPPGPEADLAARRMVAAYLNVPVYRSFQHWLGRGEALQPMNVAWDSGNRRGALAAIPAPVVRDLILSGSPEERRQQLLAYMQAGVTTPILHLVTGETDSQRKADAILRGFRESDPPA